ncbi:unnamed protein product [Spirodela intermedia]|uniref:Uncharacterized protein n=1 Tax=Spirodela intermedia TaxID=51605 RepID=A0ABN7ECQ8_SPIIN|nr:unnamed protein product [Spirodela intermedia]
MRRGSRPRAGGTAAPLAAKRGRRRSTSGGGGGGGGGGGQWLGGDFFLSADFGFINLKNKIQKSS